MREEISIFIPAVFLFVYIVLSSIEYGVSVFQLLPGILNKPGVLQKYISPVWEATNVFLVFFVVSLFTFFPKSSFFFGTYLIDVFFWALLVFGIRVLGMLYIFYHEGKNKFVETVFVLASFIGPIILSGTYVYMLTGDVAPLVNPVFPPMAGIVIFTILLISSTFFKYYLRSGSSGVENKKLDNLITTSLVLFLFTVIVLVVVLGSQAQYLFVDSTKNIIAFDLLAFAVGLFFYARHYKKSLLQFAAACALPGVLFFCLAWMHMPYIIYPVITIYNTFTDYQVFNFLIWSFAGGAIIVIPALVLLYKTFTFDKEK